MIWTRHTWLEFFFKWLRIPTQVNEYGTPVVLIGKTPLPGQRKGSLCFCGDYIVTVHKQLETYRPPHTTGSWSHAHIYWWLLFHKDLSGRCIQPDKAVTRKPTMASTQHSLRRAPVNLINVWHIIRSKIFQRNHGSFYMWPQRSSTIPGL